MESIINESHRKQLLRFLLLKTAGVRSGVKPGELLRVQHCYQSRNSEGFQFCLYRKDIFETLRLNYVELNIENKSSLVLFYHPVTLEKTLRRAEIQDVLHEFGYPKDADMKTMLSFLQHRFTQECIPHEIGIFVGYPAKDVAGFIAKLPRTPVHRGCWAVFGDARESIRTMNLYRRAEKIAENVLDVCDDLQTFFDRISNLNLTTGVMYNE